MPKSLPAISPQEHLRRERRVGRLAKRLGFVGTVEYLHETTKSGGAQFQKGVDSKHDRLIVFAEAFDRDANAEEFSLAAIIAHECGHQLLFRHPKLSLFQPGLELASEEILASLIASLIAEDSQDRHDLYAKAVMEAMNAGMSAEHAVDSLYNLRQILRNVL